MTGAWVFLCVGAHGWVAGIARHGSALLSRGWLVTLEAPGHPGHPPSTQLNAVVKAHASNGLIIIMNTLQIDACNLEFVHRGVICLYVELINLPCCNHSLEVQSLISFLTSLLESQYWF